ncbi:Mannonate dehydratase [Sodalis glossinidius str. 'morsitans']|uniref:Mannonate dehydratase n=1 Tax=Sodalis glossinidius (strain morsitans) TaxID=343509 RepID=A0A193QLF7_SODGM|nr:Mannonate dehydratase [Sodalis glossinidius str. 'morsitans']
MLNSISPAADGGAEETIVVTAQQDAGADAPTAGYTAKTSTGATKTDKPLITTGQSISVITRQQIDDQGAMDLNQVLNYTPGVFTNFAGAATRFDTISLRGFHGGVWIIPYWTVLKISKPTAAIMTCGFAISSKRLGIWRNSASGRCVTTSPILDWTRTDLEYELPDGAKALRFDQVAFAVFELHILRRAGAEVDYSAEEIQQAAQRFTEMSDEDKTRLARNIIAGLPGAEEGYTLDQFRAQLARYEGIDHDILRENFAYFLRAIIPVAEEVGVRMTVHPDDPPRPILGLPRIVSTADDMQWMVDTVASMANGFTFCTGSYGVRADNDLVGMIARFGPRIYFAHLRSTQRESNPRSFHEAAHLAGDVDMFAVIKAIAHEEQRRKNAGDEDAIPMRPDHGYQRCSTI